LAPRNDADMTATGTFGRPGFDGGRYNGGSGPIWTRTPIGPIWIAADWPTAQVRLSSMNGGLRSANPPL